MSDFTKPKILIDIEEYYSLMDNQDPSSVEYLNKLINVLLTNEGDFRNLNKRSLEIKDLVKLGNQSGIEIVIYKVQDRYEISSKYKIEENGEQSNNKTQSS